MKRSFVSAVLVLALLSGVMVSPAHADSGCYAHTRNACITSIIGLVATLMATCITTDGWWGQACRRAIAYRFAPEAAKVYESFVTETGCTWDGFIWFWTQYPEGDVPHCGRRA